MILKERVRTMIYKGLSTKDKNRLDNLRMMSTYYYGDLVDEWYYIEDLYNDILERVSEIYVEG